MEKLQNDNQKKVVTISLKDMKQTILYLQYKDISLHFTTWKAKSSSGVTQNNQGHKQRNIF